MKKLLIFIFLMSIIFSSCGGNDSDFIRCDPKVYQPEAAIMIGAWFDTFPPSETPIFSIMCNDDELSQIYDKGNNRSVFHDPYSNIFTFTDGFTEQEKIDFMNNYVEESRL